MQSSKDLSTSGKTTVVLFKLSFVFKICLLKDLASSLALFGILRVLHDTNNAVFTGLRGIPKFHDRGELKVLHTRI